MFSGITGLIEVMKEVARARPIMLVNRIEEKM